jgi:hypothetical protein
MDRYAGLVAWGLIATALGTGCAAGPDDASHDVPPIPTRTVVLDGKRYAPEDVAAAVAGRTLHYVATDGPDGELYAFEDGDQAMAFAQAAVARPSDPQGLTLPPPPPPPAARFWEDDNFGGCSFATAFDLSELFSVGTCRFGWNDVISSFNTNGRLAILYTDINFGGPSLTLRGVFPSLNPFGWNDRVSSIKIR